MEKLSPAPDVADGAARVLAIAGAGLAAIALAKANKDAPAATPAPTVSAPAGPVVGKVGASLFSFLAYVGAQGMSGNPGTEPMYRFYRNGAEVTDSVYDVYDVKTPDGAQDAYPPVAGYWVPPKDSLELYSVTLVNPTSVARFVPAALEAPYLPVEATRWFKTQHDKFRGTHSLAFNSWIPDLIFNEVVVVPRARFQHPKLLDTDTVLHFVDVIAPVGGNQMSTEQDGTESFTPLAGADLEESILMNCLLGQANDASLENGLEVAMSLFARLDASGHRVYPKVDVVVDASS